MTNDDLEFFVKRLNMMADWYDQVYPKLFYFCWRWPFVKRVPNHGDQVQQDLRSLADWLEELYVDDEC